MQDLQISCCYQAAWMMSGITISRKSYTHADGLLSVASMLAELLPDAESARTDGPNCRPHVKKHFLLSGYVLLSWFYLSQLHVKPRSHHANWTEHEFLTSEHVQPTVNVHITRTGVEYACSELCDLVLPVCSQSVRSRSTRRDAGLCPRPT